jgi:hypothetical protein
MLNKKKCKKNPDKSFSVNILENLFFIKEISTLLLCAFPAEVLLVSIGLVSPKPVIQSIRFNTVFNQIILTAAALFSINLVHRYFHHYQYDLHLRILNKDILLRFQ